MLRDKFWVYLVSCGARLSATFPEISDSTTVELVHARDSMQADCNGGADNKSLFLRLRVLGCSFDVVVDPRFEKAGIAGW